jgi:drug/metabolite transporter (DMT)-like permease
LGSGLGLSLLALARRNVPTADAGFSRADVPWLAGAIGFGGVIGPVLMLVGLQGTDSASASLLLNLEAVFTLAIAWMVFHEHVDQRLAIGAVAIVAGAIGLSWQGGMSAASMASLLIVLACLSWAVDNNLTRKISGGDPVRLAAVKGLVAGVVNFGLAKAMGFHLPAWSVVVAAGLLGFVSYGLGLVLYIVALRHLGAARTAAYYGTAPFIGASLGAVLPGGAFTPMLLMAGALMALGVWLHVSERHEHAHEHETDEHDHLHTHDEHHQHVHPEGVDPSQPHAHHHQHARLRHSHAHWPDLHHRHVH